MGHTAIAEIQVSFKRSYLLSSSSQIVFLVVAQFADYIFPAFDQVRRPFPDLSLFSRILSFRLNSKIIIVACRSSTKPPSIVTAQAGNSTPAASPYAHRRCLSGMVDCITRKVQRASSSVLLV